MSAEVIEMTPHTLQRAGVVTEGNQYVHSTPASDVALLDGLSKEHQELAVTRMLDQSKQWLDRAMEATNPAREVADFKAFVATVAEAAKQKKLSEDIQLDSTEMVRRSERALGVAIRKGQGVGVIETHDEARARAGKIARGSHQNGDNILIKERPVDFASSSELSNSYGGIYDMTDDVSDAQFEEALTDAKSEENMSRANVVRHVKRIKDRDDRAQTALIAHREDMQAWHLRLADKYPLPRLAFEAEGHERHSTAEAFASAARETYKVSYRFNEKSYARHAAQSADWLERSSMNLEVALDVLTHIDFSTITPEQAHEALQRIEALPHQLKLYIRELKGITNE